MFATLFQIILAACILMGLSEVRAAEPELFLNITPTFKVGFHIATWHSKSGLRNVNPGVYLQETKTGATMGAYCNSKSRSGQYPDAEECKLAAYAGKTFTWTVKDEVEASLTAGVIGGYGRGIMLMVLPSVLLENNLRLILIPAVDPKVKTWALHVAYEF